MGLFDYSGSAQIRFIQLTQYCVVEYILEPLGSPIFTTDNYNLLKNSYNTTNQVFNTDAALNVTGNIQDFTGVNIPNNVVAWLDSSRIPNYDQYDTNLSVTLLPEYTVVQDTVKFHFQAGFNFQSLEAVILTIKALMNSNNYLILSELVVSPQTFDEIINYDPQPLYLNGTVYDRFVIVKVPSVNNINNDFYTGPTPSSTFEYAVTNGSGLVPNIPITIGLSECTSGQPIYGTNNVNYQGFVVDTYTEAKLAQNNNLANLGAHIAEATDGDYIEFYAEWNDTFPDELIVNLNAQAAGNNWQFIHQLTVYEQVGANFIASPPYTVYQTANFDQPLQYRPVLLNAAISITTSIDYLLRLFNQQTGDQYIRSGSLTLSNPNTYGKNLLQIQLASAPQSQKIFNKIVQMSYDESTLFIEESNLSFVPASSSGAVQPVTTVTTVSYVPTFYEKANVVVAQNSYLVTVNDSTQVVAFGQGLLPIILDPFDNFFQFQVYTMNGSTAIPLALNTNSTYDIVFNPTTNPISIGNINDPTKENLGTGLIGFTVPADQAQVILKSTDNSFYITVTNAQGLKTSLYQGVWYPVSQRSTVTGIYQQEMTNAATNGSVAQSVAQINSTLSNSAPVSTAPNSSNPAAGSTVSIPGYISGGAPTNPNPILALTPTSTQSGSSTATTTSSSTSAAAG